MAKQKGLIKLTGNLQGLCYYQLNGKLVVRKASGPSKQRINTDPAFVRVKANTQEFGAASKLSKAIREGLPVATLEFKDSYMAGRLSGVCRKVIQKGSGTFGQREANLLNDPAVLIGFPLAKDQGVNPLYTAIPTISIDPSRTYLTLRIAKCTPDHLGQLPKTATHFRLIAAVSMVSGYRWNTKTKGYHPEYPKFNALGAEVLSEALACNKTHTNLHLALETPGTSPIPDRVALSLWFGISFGYLQQEEFIPFTTSRAMECITLV
jgi:hypothetical protein